MLADNLVRSGLAVWQDRYELSGGDLLARRLQDGLARSRAVVLVVSANSLGRGWVEEEFAAAVAGVVAGTQRLVPVLWGDVALPPFVASRLWVDFRAVASPEEYLAKVRELVRVLRELPSSDRPAVGEALVVPAGLAARAEGPLTARLTIAVDRVAFSTGEQQVEAAPAGVDYPLVDALYRLDGARAHPTASLGPELGRPPEHPSASGGFPVLRDDSLSLPSSGSPEAAQLTQGGEAGRWAGVGIALTRVGRLLGERFLPDAVATALTDAVQRAQARNSALRLGLEIVDEQLADLPWETLTVPGQPDPLVLNDRVEVHRLVPPLPGVEVPAVRIPGPLRVLAVIGSPDDSTGPLLDYETELRRILDAVDPARRGDAYVEILQWGSVESIRTALQRRRFHILHISCHAKPGVLQLERRDGKVDDVTVQRFIADALPADRGVPLIVLAGCSTALTPAPVVGRNGHGSASEAPKPGTAAALADTDAAAASATEQGRALGGFARGLVQRGVPAVLAMTAPVTDIYATALAAQTYGELAAAQRPDPLTALSRARRTLETLRRGAVATGGAGATSGNRDSVERAAPWAEWATPTLVTSGGLMTLFDRGEPMDELDRAVEPVFDTAMVVRRVGDFVGRRVEQRRLLAALRDGAQHAGVLIHGIGGVGKSTLTAQLIHHLGPETGLLVPVSGTTPLSPDSILETFRARLFGYCIERDLPDRSPLRQLAAALMDATPPWQTRLEYVRQVVLSQLPVTLLLDNAEDLLTAGERPEDDPATRFEFANRDLADFLAGWIALADVTGGRARTVVTSRVPFSLPKRAERRLLAHHLGPLSLAETRKLLWRLPALDALSLTEQERAVAVVGGHPRTLEYLDALLAGGKARFADIDTRLRGLLDARGIPNPEEWLVGQGPRRIDQALAEAVTLAVDDAVLGALVDRLTPDAARLLTGMAVFQMPVDYIGVAWAHHGPTTVPDVDADLVHRLTTAQSILDSAAARDTSEENDADEAQADLQATMAAFQADLALWRTPPVDAGRPDVTAALQQLATLGLVAPAPGPDDTPGDAPTGWFVHRWTASTLTAPATSRRPPSHRTQREPSVGPCDRSATTGASAGFTDAHKRAAAYWTWRVRVWPQDRTVDITQFLQARHHFYAGGDLDGALAVNSAITQQLDTWGAWTWARDLHEETLQWVSSGSGDEAHALHELGIFAQRRGDYKAAETYYRDSLTINEEIGDRASASASYHQLGILAERRGDYEAAETYYRDSLTIDVEIGDRAGVANSYGQLGNLAYRRRDHDTAEIYYRDSLAIREEIGDRPGTAKSYHQLGMLAEQRGDHDTAETYYRDSLAIKEEIGDRPGAATSLHQLGVLAQRRGDYKTARTYYRDSLAITAEIGDRAVAAATTSQLGILETEQGRPAQGMGYQITALAIRLEIGNPESGVDLYWLSQQREMLGEAAFKSVLEEHLEPDNLNALLALLNRYSEGAAGA